MADVKPVRTGRTVSKKTAAIREAWASHMEAVDAEVVEPLDRETAERLDKRIRLLVGTIHDQMVKLSELVTEAKQGNVHAALGFPSWTAYLADVFTVEVRLERDQRRELVGYLSGEGMSQRAIADVVGVSKNTVTADLRDVSQSGTPTIGLDGKTYKPPAMPKPRRKPINDAFRDAALELGKITQRIEKLSDDDRFAANADAIRTGHLWDLIRARDALERVIDKLDNKPTLGKWDESSWDEEKIDNNQRLVRMNEIMWDALGGLDGMDGKMLIRIGQSILDFIGDENKARGIARLMHSVIEFASAYKSQRGSVV